MRETGAQIFGTVGAVSFNLAVIPSETVRSAPDRPVAVYDGGQLTYAELDQASDRLRDT